MKHQSKMNLLSVSDSENFETRNLYKVVRDASGNKMYTMIAAVMNIPNQLLTIFSSMIPIIGFNILIIIPGIILAIPEIHGGSNRRRQNAPGTPEAGSGHASGASGIFRGTQPPR